MNVFIARDGETIGEYPREALEEMARNGELLPDDHYWQDGMEGWLPLPELLAPEAFEPPPPPPPPLNYRLIFGIGAGVLGVVMLIGFLIIRPDRARDMSTAQQPTAPGAPSPEEVMKRAETELRQRVDRLPSKAVPPLNTAYTNVSVNMNRTLSSRAPWSATVQGTENLLDPTTNNQVLRTDFIVTAEFRDGEWFYTHYRAREISLTNDTGVEVESDETTPTPPSIVGVLDLKRTGSVSNPQSIAR